jgi:hypothetical protein
MMFDREFVLKKVHNLISQARSRGLFQLPVEPRAIASLCSVVSVEDRPMVPEGVLAPVRGGFRVFLQDNFASESGSRIRRRFTLAHELAHTFFYSLEGDLPKPIKGTPRGMRLERLCQFAAGEILVPEGILRRKIQSEQVASADELLNLGAVFDVSLEVIFRRIQELHLVAENEFAAVLVDRVNGKDVIQTGCYGSLLLCNLPKPRRGTELDEWVGPLRVLQKGLGPEVPVTTKTAEIRTRRVYRSRKSFIFELKFSPLRRSE